MRAFSSPTDTIAAIATAPGEGGVGVVRLSGPLSRDVLDKVFRPASRKFRAFVPRTLHYGHVTDAEGRVLDDVLAVLFPAPHSFTGEDVVEIQGHGGPAVLHAVLDAVLACGESLHGVIRQAERGEFTRRAFLNGRMDLSQAEAVAELVAAPGTEGARLASAKLAGLLGKRVNNLRDRLEYLRQRVSLAVDFPEEEGECLPPDEFRAVTREVADGVTALLAGYQRARCWREGALVVLAGPVNAGKSSLMNALLGRPRAIVTERPGTTRDYLEETTSLDGLPVRLVDTAGLRPAGEDPVENEGMRRGRELMDRAQAVLVLLDGSRMRDNGMKGPSPSGDSASGKVDDLFAEEYALMAELGPERCIAVWNKADVAACPGRPAGLPGGVPLAEVCALNGMGLENLARLTARTCGKSPVGEGDIAPNLRQAHALEKALAELTLLEEDIAAGMPTDVCGVRLETAAAHLADITGLNSTEETLNAIFANFCIGK